MSSSASKHSASASRAAPNSNCAVGMPGRRGEAPLSDDACGAEPDPSSPATAESASGSLTRLVGGTIPRPGMAPPLGTEREQRRIDINPSAAATERGRGRARVLPPAALAQRGPMIRDQHTHERAIGRMGSAQSEQPARSPPKRKPNPPIIEPYALTMSAACLWSAMSRTRIEGLLSSGQVKGVRAGRRTLVLVGSLRHYLDNLPSARE